MVLFFNCIDCFYYLAIHASWLNRVTFVLLFYLWIGRLSHLLLWRAYKFWFPLRRNLTQLWVMDWIANSYLITLIYPIIYCSVRIRRILSLIWGFHWIKTLFLQIPFNLTDMLLESCNFNRRFLFLLDAFRADYLLLLTFTCCSLGPLLALLSTMTQTIIVFMRRNLPSKSISTLKHLYRKLYFNDFIIIFN